MFTLRSIADKRLYEARITGRNRVVNSTPTR